MEKSIVVLAGASKQGGALTILKQFIEHLSYHDKNYRYYIFVSSDLDLPYKNNIKYIPIKNHSIINRIKFFISGLKKWCNDNEVRPSLVISFENTGAFLKCPQIIYYHQSIPFYPEKWNFFKRDERTLFFYKYLYPFFVKASIKKKSTIVVQTDSLRLMFSKKYKTNLSKIYSFFPSINGIDLSAIDNADINPNLIHLLYPSNSENYKNHDIIIEALHVLKNENDAVINKLRVYFTIKKSDNSRLLHKIKKYHLDDIIIFTDVIPYQKLLELYKSVDALLFPSLIETIGLPLIEAAKFGLPIIASDREFAKDVLSGYPGATHINPHDKNLWANEIKRVQKNKHFIPFDVKRKSWDEFFKLIDSKI